MRHGKKLNHLGRKSAHRKAMLSNMANSLIKHKRIKTTVAKAKALRVYLEPLLTKAKNDTTHSRRVVFSQLQDKEIVHELYTEVAQKIADRPGGYTRIIRLQNRLGDNAEMCMMELVDYNENLLKETKAGKKPARKRTRRGSKATATTETASEAKATETENRTAGKEPEAENESPEAAPDPEQNKNDEENK